MLRLAEQCLERAKSFIGKSADPPDLSDSVSASSSCSAGQSEPLHTAVLPASVAANTGEYIRSNQKHSLLLTCRSITANLEPGVTNQNWPIYSHMILSRKLIFALMSPLLSQSRHLILPLTQGAKRPARQRHHTQDTAGLCPMVAGSSPLFCLLKSSTDYKQWSHRTQAKSKGLLFIKETDIAPVSDRYPLKSTTQQR